MKELQYNYLVMRDYDESTTVITVQPQLYTAIKIGRRQATSEKDDPNSEIYLRRCPMTATGKLDPDWKYNCNPYQ